MGEREEGFEQRAGQASSEPRPLKGMPPWQQLACQVSFRQTLKPAGARASLKDESQATCLCVTAPGPAHTGIRDDRRRAMTHADMLLKLYSTDVCVSVAQVSLLRPTVATDVRMPLNSPGNLPEGLCWSTLETMGSLSTCLPPVCTANEWVYITSAETLAVTVFSPQNGLES